MLGTDVGAMLGDAVGLTEGSMVGAHVIRTSGSKKSHGGVGHTFFTGPVAFLGVSPPSSESSSFSFSHMSSFGSVISKSFGSSTIAISVHPPPPLELADKATAASAAVRARVEDTVRVRVTVRTGSPILTWND